jgi:hypothetical protein
MKTVHTNSRFGSGNVVVADLGGGELAVVSPTVGNPYRQNLSPIPQPVITVVAATTVAAATVWLLFIASFVWYVATGQQPDAASASASVDGVPAALWVLLGLLFTAVAGSGFLDLVQHWPYVVAEHGYRFRRHLTVFVLPDFVLVRIIPDYRKVPKGTETFEIETVRT